MTDEEFDLRLTALEKRLKGDGMMPIIWTWSEAELYRRVSKFLEQYGEVTTIG